MGSLYYQVIKVTDYGPFVTRLVLAMPREVSEEALSPDVFSVFVRVRNSQGDIAKVPKSFLERDQMEPSVGYRQVTAVYPSDIQGAPCQQPSRFVTLELLYGPGVPCASAMVADFSNIAGHGSFMVCDYQVTLTAPLEAEGETLSGLVFDWCAGIHFPEKDRFRHGISEAAPIALRYGYYIPKLRGGKRPLIIWLHGAGEGGQDVAISYAGNKVTALTEPEIQERFGGAFVFVPQCPTMWMDDGSGQYGTEGKSMYTLALKAAIDGFIRDYESAIDLDRIYVGGDSNGGFMTMRLIMDYPDFFAAAFPICEAMPDAAISDEELGRIRDLPIWFTHAANDPVVIPKDHVLPTYHRLMDAGAKQVHFTFWEKIVDMHEGFRDPDGSPHEYMGHLSWIPVLNDDCRLDFDGKPVIWEGKEVTLLSWLALQKK